MRRGLLARSCREALRRLQVGPPAGERGTRDASSISERDYEELSLNDLIVRLVAEEIAALGGARTTGDEG